MEKGPNLSGYVGSLVKLKEAENFPTLLAEYRNRQKARYQARLEHQRKKRIKQK